MFYISLCEMEDSKANNSSQISINGNIIDKPTWLKLPTAKRAEVPLESRRWVGMLVLIPTETHRSFCLALMDYQTVILHSLDAAAKPATSLFDVTGPCNSGSKKQKPSFHIPQYCSVHSVDPIDPKETLHEPIRRSARPRKRACKFDD